MENSDETQTKMQPSQTSPVAPQEQNLSLAEIKALAKAEVADDIVISEINNTRSTFSLTAQAIIDLKNVGVSEKVIAYMMNPKPQAAAC